jgi:hypothetical protein
MTISRFAGLLALCLCLIPSLHAAVVTETFTDYNAFLKLLGSSAQVVTFDDVPTSQGFGNFLSNRYANQGLLFNVPYADQQPGYGQSAWNFGSAAVSPPNVYSHVFFAGEGFSGAFRESTYLYFTHDGRTALTSAFGTFFIGNTGTFVPGRGLESDSGISLYGAGGSILGGGTAGLTSQNGSTFLGLATIDSATGELVPSIGEIYIVAGQHNLLDVYLDNFTFAAPVPEGQPWALLAGALLAVVTLDRRIFSFES